MFKFFQIVHGAIPPSLMVLFNSEVVQNAAQIFHYTFLNLYPYIVKLTLQIVLGFALLLLVVVVVVVVGDGDGAHTACNVRLAVIVQRHGPGGKNYE